jgi:hypothetical protein
MIKKKLLFLVVLLLVMADVSPSAGAFDQDDQATLDRGLRIELKGPGTQELEQELEGDNQIRPGGVMTVTIQNNHQGYQYFFLHISMRDEQENELVIWGALVGGEKCKPGSSCVVEVPNSVFLGITANELGISGIGGQDGSRASVKLVTTNPTPQ